MSRLDRGYLNVRRHKTWSSAYLEASKATGLSPNSFKNLRDEFDPFFTNDRQGWWKRQVRPDRQRVLLEFESVSDEALTEIVSRILGGDHQSTGPILDMITTPSKRVANVAERLLTGRLAEDYFLSNCASILKLTEPTIVDVRISAGGFDFQVDQLPGVAIEVKGLKASSGNILFTDREWSEASIRRTNYWVVVIGDLATLPRHEVVPDPVSNIKAVCTYQTAIAATWRSNFKLSTLTESKTID